MKRRNRRDWRHRSARPRCPLTFDPQPWFDAIRKALETEKHPMMRRALHDAEETVRDFTKQYPPDFPLEAASIKDREILLMFLAGLAGAGCSPPGWPRLERGGQKLSFKAVILPGIDEQGKGTTE